jgi:hypothetical protein
MGCFAQQGWVPGAYSTDYRSEIPQTLRLRLSQGEIGLLDILFHEGIGLVAYWLTDRIPSFFPGPEDMETQS